LGDKNA